MDIVDLEKISELFVSHYCHLVSVINTILLFSFKFGNKIHSGMNKYNKVQLFMGAHQNSCIEFL